MLLAFVAITLGSVEPLVLVQPFDVTDGVDDNPLARDLRAAFGAGVMSCDATGCHLALVHVTCASHGCRAEDTATGRALVASGRPADALAAHLFLDGAGAFESGHAAAAEIRCSSGPATGGAVPHAHCGMVLGDGDRELAGGLSGFGGSKLGGVSWSGPIQVDCDDRTCELACTSSDAAYYMQCAANATARIADKAFDAALRRRLGKREKVSLLAEIECRGWRAEQYDGGLTSVQGCRVTR